jgi:hypothetical protein
MKRHTLWGVPMTFRVSDTMRDQLRHEARLAEQTVAQLLRSAVERELNFRRGLRTRRSA